MGLAAILPFVCTILVDSSMRFFYALLLVLFYYRCRSIPRKNPDLPREILYLPWEILYLPCVPLHILLQYSMLD